METRKSLVARIAFGALVLLLGVGLWQGYGAWLLGRVATHGY
jgi:hypothetical protein